MKMVLGGVKGGLTGYPRWHLAHDAVMKTKAECDEIAGEKPQARPPQGQQTNKRMPMEAHSPARTHGRHNACVTRMIALENQFITSYITFSS